MPRARPIPIAESDPLRILSAARPFAGLSAADLTPLADGANLLHFAKHATVWHFGSPSRHVFVVAQGLLKRSGAGPAGTEQVLDLILPGELTGLAEAITQQPHETEAIAAGGSWVLALDSDAIRAAAAAPGPVAWCLTHLLAEQRLAVEREVNSRQTQSASERLLGFLIQLAPQPVPERGETPLNLPASKHLIASRLGMTPETLSRALRDLVDAGLLIQRQHQLALSNAAVTLYCQGVPSLPLPSGDTERGHAPPLHALINIAGRQRMLTQRMARLWLMRQMGLAPAPTRRQLNHSIELFTTQQQVIEALAQRHGLDLHAQQTAALWQRFKHHIESNSRHHGSAILRESEELLRAVEEQVTRCEIACQSRHAKLVNRAGRQRMLVQRAAKFALFSSARIHAAECVRNCVETQREFVAGLRELDTLGSNESLHPVLVAIASEWNALQAVLPAESNRISDDPNALLEISERAELLVRRINDAVHICQRQAELP